HAYDARQAQIDEAVAQDGGGHFSAVALAPRVLSQAKPDLDDRLALDGVQQVESDPVAGRADFSHPDAESGIRVVVVDETRAQQLVDFLDELHTTEVAGLLRIAVERAQPVAVVRSKTSQSESRCFETVFGQVRSTKYEVRNSK